MAALRESVISRITSDKLIAIVRGIQNRDHCLKVAQALVAGGIGLIEVTFNQSAPDRFSDTTAAIAAMSEVFGDRVCMGAGTVLTPREVELAAEAGAKYIISPNTNAAVIKRTRDLGLVSIPGIVTPTELVNALEAGADFGKLFPAGTFGSGYVKALKAPLSHAKILAVGGVDANTIPEFLAASCEGFGIGGNLVKGTWIEAGQFDKITEVARDLYKATHGKLPL